jgi:hypothetical protein
LLGSSPLPDPRSQNQLSGEKEKKKIMNLGFEPCQDFVVETLKCFKNITAGDMLYSGNDAWIAAKGD